MQCTSVRDTTCSVLSLGQRTTDSLHSKTGLRHRHDILPALPTSPLPLQRAVAIEAAPVPVTHTYTHTDVCIFFLDKVYGWVTTVT